MGKRVSSSSSSGGIGFFGLLTVVLIVLKLLGVIEWAWIWVLAPCWGGAILWIVLVVGLVAFLAWIQDK